MPAIQHVCVIGAGLAGLACAFAAAAAGCKVDVVTSAPAIGGHPASHLGLGPHALRALAMLGLGSAVVAAGFAYQGVGFVDERGGPLFEIETPRLAGARLPAALGLGLATLLGLLAAAAQREGARVHLGQRIEVDGADALAAAPHPRFAGHAGAVPDRCALQASPPGSADLIVVAAGLDSPLRRALFPAAPAVDDLGQHWWQALLPRPHALERATWVIGAGGSKLLLVPVSVDQAGVALSRPAAALAECRDTVSLGASLRAALRFAAPVLPSLEGRLGDAAAVSVRPVRAALLPAPWQRGRVLGVGDFAHTLPPHFGQAAAQSLEDAAVLGELLRSGVDRDALLAGFAARRPPRAAAVHAIVSQAARWSQRPDSHTDLRALHTELAAVVDLPA